jgi:hypothetical protein
MMIGMMVSGVFFLLVVLIAFGLAGNAMWRALVPPQGLPRSAGCGSCGYELTTLANGRCSECGADLIMAGVTTRRNAVRTAGSLPAALMGWTLIVTTLVVIAMYTVSVVTLTRTNFAAGMSYTSNYTYRPARIPPGTDATPIDFRLRVDVDVVGNFGGRASSGEIAMELSAQGSAVNILFTDATGDGWMMTRADGTEIASGTDLRDDDILLAFRAIGIDPDANPLVADYAARIEDLALAALANPFNYESSLITGMAGITVGTVPVRLEQSAGTSNYGGGAFSPFGTGSAADYLVPLGIFGGGLAVWIVGTVFIVRRRGRLIEGPRPTV